MKGTVALGLTSRRDMREHVEVSVGCRCLRVDLRQPPRSPGELIAEAIAERPDDLFIGIGRVETEECRGSLPISSLHHSAIISRRKTTDQRGALVGRGAKKDGHIALISTLKNGGDRLRKDVSIHIHAEARTAAACKKRIGRKRTQAREGTVARIRRKLPTNRLDIGEPRIIPKSIARSTLQDGPMEKAFRQR